MHVPTFLFCLLGTLALCTPAADAAPRRKKRSSARIEPAPAVAADRKIPSASGKPNVLFILVDDLNDYVGWMGGHPQARTPHMDGLAKMGMRFTNAHTAYALCNPSRTALLTGVAPWKSGVHGDEQDWRYASTLQGKWTLPECFRLNGYTTAGGGKIFHASHGGPQGRLSGWHGGRRGFEQDAAWDLRFPTAGVQIADLPVHIGQNFNGLNIWHWDWKGLDTPEQLMDDAQTVDWAANFLASAINTERKPFFLTVGIYRPHSPWYVPQRYYDAFPLGQIQLPQVKESDLDDVPAFAKGDSQLHEQVQAKGAWKAAVQAYLASVSFADAQVGKLLAALESSPAARDTIICLTSDHGYHLGEKQHWHKGTLWEDVTRVPLTIYAPGVTTADTVCTQPVSLLDVYPTLVQLTSVEQPTHLDGTSLAPSLQNPASLRTQPAITASVSADQPSYAARSDRWRYIRHADGSEELYDHQTDPHEWINVAPNPTNTEIKTTLQAALPTQWATAARPTAQILRLSTQGEAWSVTNGDEVVAAEAPQIQGKGIDIEAAFTYSPEVDADSTLVSQGDAKNGWLLHLVEGRPTLTVRMDGQSSSAQAAPMSAGPVVIRAQIPADGTLCVCASGQSQIIERSPFPSGFPTQPSGPLRAGQSFGPLSLKEYPNSTPLDAKLQRLWVSVLP
jgi:arylsulfatase A-like enzyme